MATSRLAEKASEHLDTLCSQIPNRRVGSEGNRLATAFFAETIETFGFEVERPEFSCMDWQGEGRLFPPPANRSMRGSVPIRSASGQKPP